MNSRINSSACICQQMMKREALYPCSDRNMKVSYHKNFDKDLEKYATHEQIREIFLFVDELESAESLREFSNIKKLAGFKEFYRTRFGEYRLGFRIIDGKSVQLDRFLHRRDIYKKYP
jgi:mRNA interferase RelE/StbE